MDAPHAIVFQMAKWFGIEDFFKMLTEEQLVFIELFG